MRQNYKSLSHILSQISNELLIPQPETFLISKIISLSVSLLQLNVTNVGCVRVSSLSDFRYLDSTIPRNSKPSSVAVQPGLCRTRSEDRFSHDAAHMHILSYLCVEMFPCFFFWMISVTIGVF